MHSSLTLVLCLSTTLYAVCAAEDAPHKRAPSGFTGVRGKKSIPDSAYSEEAPDFKTISEFKRAPSGFMGMRGKKPYPQVWEGTYPDEIYNKRGPSGFMGMRGKKDMEFPNYGDDNSKRAPSGFMGMRGKKDFTDLKRAPMGFMGMRGKKNSDYDNYFYEDMKRTPSGFFGMRGKKQPSRQSGFFGMRGKKYPYEFRGKFVGVRGKKLADETSGPDYYDLNNLDQDLDINQLMLLLTENDNAIFDEAEKFNSQN